MNTHWKYLVESPNLWKAPLRPSTEDVKHVEKEIIEGSRTLLLGVTSELQQFAEVAIDNNLDAVLANPKIAIFGDWADLPFESEFDTIIGDGCLNVFQGGPETFFNQMKKALKKSGKLVLRVFTSPENRENLNDVLNSRESMGFDAFQLRVTNAIANPYVSVQERCKIIKSVWNHPNLEIYQGSNLVYYHPKLSELPPYESISYSSSYELAERCPIITWKF